MPSAGEVEQFAYCAHNWWLARAGRDGHDAGSERGVEEHRHLQEAQHLVERRQRDYRDGMRWSFRILMAATSGTFLTLEVLYLRAHPLHFVFLTTALLLTSLSAALLAIALFARRDADRLEDEHGFVHGEVQDQAWLGGQPLRDPEWGLSGKPDYVVETEAGVVPVEVKTGMTPRTPFPSHRLQVACYLRLLEANGAPLAGHGMLTYPEGVFQVAWDDGTQADLRATLERMAAAQAEGRADRDHGHVGRCRGCARRRFCDQSLA